jgi:hypothetical protein
MARLSPTRGSQVLAQAWHPRGIRMLMWYRPRSGCHPLTEITFFCVNLLQNFVGHDNSEATKSAKR